MHMVIIMARKKNVSPVSQPASILRLNERKMAYAGGVVGALSALGFGFLRFTMGGFFGGAYMMGGGYGYGFAPFGILYAALWAMVIGAIVGYVFTWVYNKA